EGGPGPAWRLFLQPTSHPHKATWSERVTYSGRTLNAVQDWKRFPVSGVGPIDAAAFTSWLDKSGRVPQARLCTELEWEKAARGADGRTFTMGNRFDASLANVDVTYGQTGATFGPDEVGRHAESDSPYGLHDMQGNALEVVWSRRAARAFKAKGGCW